LPTEIEIIFDAAAAPAGAIFGTNGTLHLLLIDPALPLAEQQELAAELCPGDHLIWPVAPSSI
jgi:hypothetical protein